ncbi:hypothetical protein [Acidipropionibacterium virtanenii]|uniref:Uncharacterized protein n=1 Tax=Acidipropionibacterium virtanenii TaxID=2057246 RepID=A0A344UPN5_9ACTN|nr:hypothetical protein [Acidipropionibacterium virtanenii]AXE37233.1 hypothetical protein JS278_00035 [Acidipropionibacterium virtanenii]
MADDVIQRGWRYEDHIAYAAPDSLDDLHGPTTGRVRVGGHIDTSLNPVYDLGNAEDRWSLYSAVVRSGTRVDQMNLLDKGLLLTMWPSLNLPMRCRKTWQMRFTELAEPVLRNR